MGILMIPALVSPKRVLNTTLDHANEVILECIYVLLLCVHMRCVYDHVCHYTHMEVRERFCRVGFFLPPPCELWGLSSSCQACAVSILTQWLSLEPWRCFKQVSFIEFLRSCLAWLAILSSHSPSFPFSAGKCYVSTLPLSEISSSCSSHPLCTHM